MRAGQFLANFEHGRGDYAGVSPKNNDLGTMTMPVGSFRLTTGDYMIWLEM